MAELGVLFGLAIAFWVFVSPLLTLMNVRAVRKRQDELEGRLGVLDFELHQLRHKLSQQPAPRQELSAPVTPGLVVPLLPVVEIERAPTQPLQPPPPVTAYELAPTPVAAPEPTPPASAYELAPTPPSDALPGPAPTPTPTPVEPVQPAPVVEAKPVAPARPATLAPWSPSLIPESLLPAASVSEKASADPSVPRVTSSIDIEKFLGVRGAAGLGGIAFVIAGTLFAKYSIENNLIPPSVRIALLILFGAAALLASEWPLRPRYAVTANAVAGAGIAILYSAFFAGHSLYTLFDGRVTLALMVLTTVVAALLSLRYDSMFIAGLGLVGGFATPLMLSTGQDRPIALFSYVLLLDIGFLVLAIRRGWHALTMLSLVLTLLMGTGWMATRMTPEKMIIGVGAATIFALIYLTLPSIAGWFSSKPKGEAPEDGAAGSKPTLNQTLLLSGTLAGLAPFLLAFYISGAPGYAVRWPILYGFLACLNAAIVVVAVRRGPAYLSVAAAVATLVSVILSTAERSFADDLWSSSLATIGLYGLVNLGGRLRRLWPPKDNGRSAAQLREEELLLEGAGLIGVAGLAVYTVQLLQSGQVTTPWLAWTMLATLFALLWERGQAHGLRLVVPGGALVLGALTLSRTVSGMGVHFWMQSSSHLLLRELAAPALLAVAYALLASVRTLRARASTDEAERRHATETEVGGLITLGWGLIGLAYCVGESALSLYVWPLFWCLLVYNLLLFAAALRRTWTALLPAALVITALLVSAWHIENYQNGDFGYALSIYGALCLSFLALPLALVSRLRRTWQTRRGPYLTASLAGAAFFPIIYDSVVRSWGKGMIGVLPLFFAALSVGGLLAVQGLPKLPLEWLTKIGISEATAARRRLGNRALFAAAALGFITLAVPLQLDRQWIIVAWALEAAAVMRLFQLLPHPGLKYFGVALFGLVASRLLLDPNVLSLHPRGYVIINWLLYTYGLPAVCFLVGGAWLRTVEVEKHDPWERRMYGEKPVLATIAAFIGLVLVFVLLNLEIQDGFSTGRYAELSFERHYARDLTTSLSWALYALALLLIGMWRQSRSLRFVSLGFLVLTILKVFLLDLSNLSGVYRPLSFLGLAASLILVSLLYQRFVFREEKKGASDASAPHV